MIKTKADLTEWQLANRRVVCAACRYEDVIFCGARHYDRIMCGQIDLLKAELELERLQADKVEQGFIDQFGVFLDREEALQVAIESGQHLDMDRNGSETELFSEGLY